MTEPEVETVEETEPVKPELETVGGLRIADKLHTVHEVAAIFSVDAQTVRIWLREGKLQGVKVGRPWLISRQAMQDYAVTRYGT